MLSVVHIVSFPFGDGGSEIRLRSEAFSDQEAAVAAAERLSRRFECSTGEQVAGHVIEVVSADGEVVWSYGT